MVNENKLFKENYKKVSLEEWEKLMKFSKCYYWTIGEFLALSNAYNKGILYWNGNFQGPDFTIPEEEELHFHFILQEG
ncbi:MAG: hypothetical protein ACFFDF_25595 [Candidatus Odinarchaeota archaeon]